ncbi:prepilin-type N-terminal cleavage/methylation domain-containing protein [Candidatus Pseudothioglobus singularis]|uniref:Prepilin-type N-terminal cleavage/methylation domain-containing protein n=1 Tax=Candidatus Pseudothioglobus singularis PS1 TaxID=1125411 RepID=A0A0M4M499_9GAMM|nr:prepilin-type N-terminal cleavage/methylation domain-containing protein [Candidatus Pseudothioglobus singularis]ALE02654.1 hypothetical protein W908_03255 [Candidatus Pseudothioglobus singularis PS1]
MRHNIKAFTLVEMLVALAVSSIIVAATYASFELIQKQYKKNIDVAELHTSGRAVMSILEREIRMAGFEYRDGNGLMTYGTIAAPLVTTDSGNKCCDEVTIIYDEVFDTLNASGVVTSSTVERVKTRFWTEPYTSSKHGTRNRLFKRRTILGTNNALLAAPRVGAKDVMADYIEDLQFVDILTSTFLASGSDYNDNIELFDISTKSRAQPDGWIIGTSKNGALASGNGGKLYSGSEMKEGITIYEPFKNKSGRKSFFQTDKAISALAVDSSGLIYAGFNRATGIRIYNPETGSKIGEIPTSINISSIAIGPDGILYAGNKSFTTVYMYSTSKGTKIGEVQSGRDVYDKISAGHIAFSKSNGYISANNKYVVKIFRVSDSVITGFISANPVPGPIAFGSDGYLYVGTLNNPGIRIFNPNTGALVGSIPTKNRTDALTFISESSGSKWLVSISLSLRSKGKYGKNRKFSKKDYHPGNYIINKNDDFFRDVFTSTVLVRNMKQ